MGYKLMLREEVSGSYFLVGSHVGLYLSNKLVAKYTAWKS